MPTITFHLSIGLTTTRIKSFSQNHTNQTNKKQMTATPSSNNLVQQIDSMREQIVEEISFSPYEQIYFLKRLTQKLYGYCDYLIETNPEDAELKLMKTASVALFRHLDDSYSVDVDAEDDERNDVTEHLFNTTVQTFISDFSDDAGTDFLMLGAMFRFVSDMSVHNWAAAAEEKPDRLGGLQAAKRDEEYVNLVIHTITGSYEASRSDD